MQKLIINLLILLLQLLGPTETKKNDIIHNELKGKVKSSTVTIFGMIDRYINKPIKEFRSKSKIEYNSNGYKTHLINYNQKEEKIYETFYKYDANGKMIGPDVQKGAFGSKTVKSKDKAGNIIETVNFNSGAKLIKILNRDGLVCEEIFSDAHGKIMTRGIFKYDNKGNKIMEEGYGPELNLLNKIVSKYDGMNRNIESIYYNRDGKITTTINTVYNTDGWELKKMVYVASANKAHTWKYNYSNYDKNGNWLNAVTIYDGKVSEMKEREIKY